MTDAADAVWNRAAMHAGGLDARAGDQTVAAMLRFHGRAMSSGVVDALMELDPIELDDAIDGYRYIGLDGAADVTFSLRQEVDLRAHEDGFEGEADSRYASVVPDDATLAAAFEQLFRDRPGDFAPIG